MNVTGKVKVYKNDKGYYTQLRNSQSGDKCYLDLSFRKGTEIDNNTFIEITNGFVSFYKTSNGLTKIKIVVLEFTTEQDIEKAEQNYAKEEREAIQNEDGYVDDLPF